MATTCEEFKQELLEALGRLHTPDYEPSPAFCRVLGCEPADGAMGVQAAIIRAIESLQPTPGAPTAAAIRRFYNLLHERFVLGLTREETADRLHISVSSVQRTQREAVHMLARLLWEREQSLEAAGNALPGGEALGPLRDTGVPAGQAADWHVQVQREVASLRTSAPGVVSDVGEVIGSVLEITKPLMRSLDVRSEVSYIQPGLAAATHPVLLRQVLITALDRLAHEVIGEISIYARLEGGEAIITLTGSLAPGRDVRAEHLAGDFLAVEGISTELAMEGDQVFLWIKAPTMGKTTVLVVDDNPDIVRFFSRCVEGTRYRLVHLPHAQGLVEMVRCSRPDVIVLDVMLPDVDGWWMLMQLHEDPDTRQIPVVVCTVVREEALALSLGAAAFLSKPVHAQELIHTLDRVAPQAPEESPMSLTSSAAAC